MRQEKQLLLDEIKEQIDRSGSFIVMSYKGLTANLANDFRREVAKLGGNIEVVRKRVLCKAAESAGVKLDIEALTGHIGLVFSGENTLDLTKTVIKFGKDNNDSISVIGGRMDGQLYNADQMQKLSELPSKDEMRAQFLSVLEAPLSHTLGTMDALLLSVVYCLDNKCKQQEEEIKQ